MIRTQIRLTAAQASSLKRLAREQQCSVATLIRQGVDLYLANVARPRREQLYARARRVVGWYQGGAADLGRDHDRHLADAYATADG